MARAAGENAKHASAKREAAVSYGLCLRFFVRCPKRRSRTVIAFILDEQVVLYFSFSLTIRHAERRIYMRDATPRSVG